MFGFSRLNAAVVGTGYMAAKMTEVLNSSSTARPYAVVSRDLDRALQFGRANGFKKAYDSMANMLSDKKVDFVYIATPASEHAAQVRQCIEAGKPVLCETPIALTHAEADSLFSLASSLDVLVVEAMHIRFLPFFRQIVSVISSGAIGTPVMLTAGIASDIENIPRLQRPSLGGGALGDLGYFLLNFSSMIFGDHVKRIQSGCSFSPVRVDRQLSLVLQYKDDKMAVLSCTTSGNGESRAVIQGTKGYMVIEDLRNFESATVYDSRRNKTGVYKRGKQKSEFEFELSAFTAAMKSGWKECPEIPHAKTLSMMQMMDFIRRQLGISYEDLQISQIPGMIEAAGHVQNVIHDVSSGTDEEAGVIAETSEVSPASKTESEIESETEGAAHKEETSQERPLEDDQELTFSEEDAEDEEMKNESAPSAVPADSQEGSL